MTRYVDVADRIAEAAHAGQFDQAGAPYIGHPRRVAATVHGDEATAVALLHDVLEDTEVTPDDLAAAGIPREVIDAVIAITHLPNEPYDHYLARVAANPLATIVKYADMNDNTDPGRLAVLDAGVRDRLTAKYARARDTLARHVNSRQGAAP